MRTTVLVQNTLRCFEQFREFGFIRYVLFCDQLSFISKLTMETGETILRFFQMHGLITIFLADNSLGLPSSLCRLISHKCKRKVTAFITFSDVYIVPGSCGKTVRQEEYLFMNWGEKTTRGDFISVSKLA